MMPRGGFFIADFFNIFFTAHHSGGIHNGIDNRNIACAAADIAVFLEPITHLLARGVGVGLQQGIGGNNKARGAKATLRCAMKHPCFLQRVQLFGSANAFQGSDSRIVSHAFHF